MTGLTVNCSGTIRIGSAFAVQHLLAAARFSHQCREVEKENEGRDFGNFFNEIIACTSASVLLAVASIESNINEHLDYPNNIFPKLPENAARECCQLLSRLPILEKYNRALSINGLPPQDEGKLNYQNTKALISLRNELVHFHPEWQDDQKKHKSLSAQLRGKFPLTSFISESTGSPVFPYRIMGHGCTKWAVATAREFMKTFSIITNTIDRFEKFDNQIAP